MDDDAGSGGTPPNTLLAAALRGIRLARGLRTSEVAAAMGLQIRKYQRFERGETPFDLDDIKAFANATDCDPFAIIASLWMEAPEFAIRTIDTKPLVVFALALRSFHEDVRDDIGAIEPRVWWGGFRRLFQDLTEHLRKRDLTAETWLDEHARRLGLKATFLAGGPRRAPRKD